LLCIILADSLQHIEPLSMNYAVATWSVNVRSVYLYLTRDLRPIKYYTE